MRYIIGSGFIGGPGREEFAEVWIRNLVHHIRPDPTRIVILSVAHSKIPLCLCGKWINVVDLDGNCGHIHHILHNEKPHAIGGWSASILALAMMAYNDESDLLYREQDCLCFGPWVERMYADLADGDMVFGGKQNSPPYMPCAQSLFLIRHRFILEFVSRYIAMGDERRLNGEQKADNLPEDKFCRLRDDLGGRVKTLSFGVDRERPLPLDQDVFYCQQLNLDDLAALRERGMV